MAVPPSLTSALPRPAVTCRTCGSHDTACVGRLPDVAEFAGATLETPLPGGHLHACRACGFVFRAPVLSEADYLALYARGSAAVWEQEGDREDFRRVRAEVGSTAGRATGVPDVLDVLDVLDVGCYTGHLLATLPPSCRLHGVEPNPQAAAMAATRGVHIVAQHWQQLPTAGPGYDIVIACDVIEHVADPLAFLRALSACLKPGGRLILSTGNAQAWPWRLAGAQCWYAYFPEHISFIGPRWLAHMGPAAGLQAVRLQPFAHSPLPGPVWRLRALAAACLGRLAAALRRDNAATGRPARLLGGGIASDHLFCVLRKVAAQGRGP